MKTKTEPTPALPVVVGLDGSESGAAALTWAAAEAERAGCELLIVHAANLDTSGPLTGMASATAHEELMAFGRQLVADAVTVLAETQPRLVVRTRVELARPAALLGELSHAASLIVIGRSPTGRLVHFLLGAVSHRVAAHAACPVVIVGKGEAPEFKTIGVGVSASSGGLAAMRLACQLAVEHHGRVVAFRSWSQVEQVSVDAAFIDLDQWRESEQAILSDWVAQARLEFPGVRIEPNLSGRAPENGLIGLSRNVDLLVLGCRRSEDSKLPKLGPITAWLMDRAHCPVAITHEAEPTEPALSEWPEVSLADA